ncbi:MAG: helix-turn-helix domain-containing protein, partial [Porticoccaceae bacterium]|nr:helix-turn-helix domain-containing protein [Porticoccaceae bacterium]
MLRTHYAAAIGCARGNALDEIMREVWTRYGAGQLSDDEAGELMTLAEGRRAAWRGSGQVGLGLVMPPPAERCPTPVRRHSHIRGRSEGRIWRPTTRKDVQAILKAAEIYNEAGLRQKGERSGPLGSVALDVLRLFVNLIDFRTGRLEPSITTIMDRLGRSRDTIVRALKNLRAHGFIDWLRRYEPTGNEGRGPQVQQTSNA